jgi:hypothetical protein
MVRRMPLTSPQLVDSEWIAFPGGELEGTTPKALCPDCCARLTSLLGGHRGPDGARGRTLCFQCYRTDLERDRALRAAAGLETASEARFQTTLPFEPVDRLRLERLKTERIASRQMLRVGLGPYTNKRRQAQIAARHALQRLASGLQAQREHRPDVARTLSGMVRAAELQLPESWLPFVTSRLTS